MVGIGIDDGNWFLKLLENPLAHLVEGSSEMVQSLGAQMLTAFRVRFGGSATTRDTLERHMCFPPKVDTAALYMTASISDESPTPDPLSLKEETRFALAAERQEQIRKSVHGGMILFIRVAIGLTVAVFIIRVLQFVLPTGWRWLTEEQTHDIDKILSGGAFGAFIAKYLSTAIFPDKKR